ncbi:MAG: hypothetical protein HKP30_17530 [Myxococcales bacterium]|nr:hypothetical protein [Myxococcales bacterium]
MSGTRPVRALVRSERAATSLDDLVAASAGALDVRIVDYADEDGIRQAGEGCPVWVHLVGILKESKRARYADAHEGSCEVLARAAEKASAARIVYISILGSRPDAKNACLASKGRAEAILMGAATPVTTLRVPLVLGPDELAAAALRGQATAPVAFLTRGGATLEQPIDERDLVRAIQAAADLPADEEGGLDLAGPESLTHRALVARVAGVLGRPAPRVLPVPLLAVQGLAGLFEAISAEPPVTRAMLGVLEHDDAIDPAPSCRRLGLELTPLDETLRHVFGAPSPPPSPEPS